MNLGPHCRQWFLAGMGLILLFFLGGCGDFSFRPPLVGVIQWTKEVQAYEECLNGVVEGLRENGYQDGFNIRLRVINAGGDRSLATAAARDFQKRGAKLLITLGTVPTLAALEVTRGCPIPIVYSIVAAPAATGIAWPDNPAQIQFTGTSMEVSPGEQLGYLLQVKPRIKRLGILYCTATPQAVATGEAVRAAAQARGLVAIRETIFTDRPKLLQQALSKLIYQNIDALFLPCDPVLVKPDNLKIICATAQRAKIPVMVPSGSSVPFGALMAYHSDFMEIGRQAGRQAARILAGAPIDSVLQETPKIKRLTINLGVARDLNLPLSRQVLNRAYKLY